MIWQEFTSHICSRWVNSPFDSQISNAVLHNKSKFRHCTVIYNHSSVVLHKPDFLNSKDNEGYSR